MSLSTMKSWIADRAETGTDSKRRVLSKWRIGKKELTINPKMMVEKNTGSAERGTRTGSWRRERTYKDGEEHGLSRDWYETGS